MGAKEEEALRPPRVCVMVGWATAVKKLLMGSIHTGACERCSYPMLFTGHEVLELLEIMAGTRCVVARLALLVGHFAAPPAVNRDPNRPLAQLHH